MKALFSKMFFTSKVFKKWRFISYLTIIGFLSVCINTVSADSSVTCKKPEQETDEEKKKTTFCFFSLNNPKEVEKLREKYKGNENVEVKEFYQEEGKSVKESFKKMMETQLCDALVISGHHTGYFAGKKSVSEYNDSQALELDFMEEMACEDECEGWFSNVNSLFLMGCQTVKADKRLQEDTDTADSETIRVITDEAKEEGTKHINQHMMINQAYSSTLDENNKLSHRYLRMFPNSSLYGWGEKAPGEEAGSEDSLPIFIDTVTNIMEPSLDENDHISTDNITNFIDFMNSSKTCKGYVANLWTQHWTKDTAGAPTACYLKEGADKEKFKKYRKKGCDLAKAIKEDNKDDIIKSIDDILTPDDDDTTGEEIKANFNRLMSLITNKENKAKPWYQEVISKLKGKPEENNPLKNTLINELLSDKVGFTRKADYLYFYKEMGWTDSKEEISEQYLTQLQDAFNNINAKNIDQEIKIAHHYSVFTSIAQNKLGKWLSENDPDGFKKLRDQFVNSPAEWDQIPGHFLSHLGSNVSEQDKNAANTYLEKKKEEIDWFNDFMCKHEPYVAEEIELFDCQ